MTEPIKTVCIVGAGPAGLVTVKSFLQHGGFAVAVFEAADHVGGMWRGRPGENGDKCSPDLKTNLSRFTVAFPDLAWSSIDLTDPITGFCPPSPPVFPKAWQVGRYLEAYTEKFGLAPQISLNSRVVKAWILDDFMTWQVVVEDTVTKRQRTMSFDYLVIASGFFDKPARSFSPSSLEPMRNVQHSSRFRDLADLTSKAGKIVVIGGGISGSEAAANAAFQISSAQNSSSKIKPEYASSKVYHIINRPFYCLPRYLPQNPHDSNDHDFNPAPTFLPLDLVLYNLSRRAEGQITAAITTVPPEKALKGHEFMRSMLGGDQSDLGHSGLVYKADQTQYPGYTGITDTYTEFVRSGLIVPVQGWVEDVKYNEDEDTFDVAFKQYEPWYHAPHKEAKVSH